MNTIKLNENERKVLSLLDEHADHWADSCVAFSWIADETKLGLKEARCAARSLRGKGMAEFHRGLMTAEGQAAGSGYRISVACATFLHPRDVSGQRGDLECDGKRNVKLIAGKVRHHLLYDDQSLGRLHERPVSAEPVSLHLPRDLCRRAVGRET